jgi:hypothetical protein
MPHTVNVLLTVGQAAVKHYSVKDGAAQRRTRLAQRGEAVDGAILPAESLDQGSGEGIVILDQQQAQSQRTP